MSVLLIETLAGCVLPVDEADCDFAVAHGGKKIAIGCLVQNMFISYATILYARLQVENVMFKTKSAVYTVNVREIQRTES